MRSHISLLGIGQRFHDKTESYGMIVYYFFDHDGLTLVVGYFLLERPCKTRAYFLYDTFPEHLLVIHIDDLIFERRTACVQYQYFHCEAPVIAKW